MFRKLRHVRWAPHTTIPRKRCLTGFRAFTALRLLPAEKGRRMIVVIKKSYQFLFTSRLMATSIIQGNKLRVIAVIANYLFSDCYTTALSFPFIAIILLVGREQCVFQRKMSHSGLSERNWIWVLFTWRRRRPWKVVNRSELGFISV